MFDGPPRRGGGSGGGMPRDSVTSRSGTPRLYAPTPVKNHALSNWNDIPDDMFAGGGGRNVEAFTDDAARTKAQDAGYLKPPAPS